ncbi:MULTISPECIES: DUF2285 domain-containing protein [Hyphomicrobiales]
MAISHQRWLTNTLPDRERVMGRATQTFLDEPPSSHTLTSYDREHMKLYMRLLDAERDGADWREAVRILFDLDPDLDPQRCRFVHDAHLARAHWMTERGYRELVRESQQRPSS